MNTHFRAIRISTERYVGNIAEDNGHIQSNLQSLDDRNSQRHQKMRKVRVNAEQQKHGTLLL